MVRLPAGACSGPEIPSFYRGRSIFITGGTGFMGKVLIERLLSTCPDVNKLYLLMREKKGLSPDKRLQQLKQCQVFEGIVARDRGLLDKMEAVAGDVTRPRLGLSRDAQAALREVSLVFHIAATVKLQEKLRQAVSQNLRPVTMLLDLCDSLPHVEAFVFVSTAYSNAELSMVEEKVYPAPMSLHTLLSLVEDQTLNEEDTRKCTASKPNTYTFTKAMAEDVTMRRGCGKYPVAIFRPSIVVSSLKHPFPGWIENLNGPSGVIAGSSAGLLRVFRARATARADLLPVDIAIDTLIAVGWETAVDKSPSVRVYNCTSGEQAPTWGQFRRTINAALPRYPAGGALFYPHLISVENGYWHKFLELFLQTIPLYMVEYVSRVLCINSHRNLIKVDAQLKAMNQAFTYFALRDWGFERENVARLRRRLTAADRALYNLDPATVNWEELLIEFVKGTRKYVLQEKDHQLESARTHIQMLGYLHTLAKVLVTLVLLRVTTRYVAIQVLINKIFLICKLSIGLILR